jgi:hypothetical protein
LIGGRLVVRIELENRIEMFLGVLQLVDAQKCLQMERQNLWVKNQNKLLVNWYGYLAHAE